MSRYTLTEIGGAVTPQQLVDLWEFFKLHDMWVLDVGDPNIDPARSVRGETALGKNRMLGDPCRGPDDEELLPCAMVDWLQHCFWRASRKECVRLAAVDQGFSDDEVSGFVSAMRIDFKIECPHDEENQCEAITYRPTPDFEKLRIFYVDPFGGDLRLSVAEVVELLDKPAAARKELAHYKACTQPLRIIQHGRSRAVR